ncbi:hypothetical protein [Pseudomonas serbica]|uniref:hypothetical protein n=1 Tax=Pseudomonas serbica TaxID=2965074 RepID=UPI00237B4014|nr:hypothetical protein [Pseudomonas serbica]
MVEVTANLDQMMELIKRLDPRDGEVVAKAIGEIELSRKRAKDLQHYGKWYLWLRDRIAFRTSWTDEKLTYVDITGSTFIQGDQLQKTHDSVDDWVKAAIKAESKLKGKK